MEGAGRRGVKIKSSNIFSQILFRIFLSAMKLNELLVQSLWLHIQKIQAYRKKGNNSGKSSQTTEKVNDKSVKLVSNFVNVFFLG